jgi:hypothetical protein
MCHLSRQALRFHHPLLDRHSDEVHRERAAQDEALRAARAVFGARAEPQERHVPASTVVAKLVPGVPPGRTAQEWDEAGRTIAAAPADLLNAVPMNGDRFVNLARLRQEIHEDGVLSSAPVERSAEPES